VKILKLDVKDDKSLWPKENIEGVGKVLLVEESYYDGIVEMIEELKSLYDYAERSKDFSDFFKQMHYITYGYKP
jgi:hypothetical protein